MEIASCNPTIKIRSRQSLTIQGSGFGGPETPLRVTIVDAAGVLEYCDVEVVSKTDTSILVRATIIPSRELDHGREGFLLGSSPGSLLITVTNADGEGDSTGPTHAPTVGSPFPFYDTENQPFEMETIATIPDLEV